MQIVKEDHVVQIGQPRRQGGSDKARAAGNKNLFSRDLGIHMRIKPGKEHPLSTYSSAGIPDTPRNFLKSAA